MLSHRQQSVNAAASSLPYSPEGDTSSDEESPEAQPLTGAIAVKVNEGRKRTTAAGRANNHAAASSSPISSPHDLTLNGSINATYARRGAVPMPSASSICCCLSLRSPTTRRLHWAFCKALAWTCLALLLVFLLGVVVEPLFLEPDGWMDCVDAGCTIVKPPPTLLGGASLPIPSVGEEDEGLMRFAPRADPHSLLVSAIKKTDASAEHAITSPAFFHDWHEQTVSDFLDRRKEVAAAVFGPDGTPVAGATGAAAAREVDELTRASDAGDHASPVLAKQLYMTGDGSVHTDASRSRELHDGEKAQLEKAYRDLVPWLPHHMRLGMPLALSVPVSSKTTAPLLSREMLDATAEHLTNHCPGCMWLRVWIVDSTLYVHSFNERKETEFSSSARGAQVEDVDVSSSPTNVFGYESSRLNHFLMMLLHVLSLSLSGRLRGDTSFHSLPAQPASATGAEDAFPPVDLLFSIGDQPCGNLSKQVHDLENWRWQLTREVEKATAAQAAATAAAAGGAAARAAFLQMDEELSPEAASPAAPSAIDVADDEDTAELEESVDVEADVAGVSSLVSRLPGAAAIREQPSVFHSILSFQSGYGDESTRELLLLPRTLEEEVSYQERLKAQLRRGKYPKPPKHLAPVFGIRQTSAASMVPPPGALAHLGGSITTTAAAEALQGFSLAGALFASRQLLLSSPTLLLPDFTRWSELVAIEEESQSAAVQHLVAPKSAGPEAQHTREEGGLEEDAAVVAGSEDAEGAPAASLDPAHGAALPTIHALKLHQLHNKQIAHLRSTQKIMLVLSPLPALSPKQLADQADELEVSGLSRLNPKDIHNLENNPLGAPDRTKAPPTLVQRMLDKMHILLKHRLVHSWDYPAFSPDGRVVEPEEPGVRHKNKVDGEGLLNDIMSLLRSHYESYSGLVEQREFEEKFGTGFKIYDSNSIVPVDCHLPFVVYEESAANVPRVRTHGGRAEAAQAARGGDSNINPAPGTWAHWMWRCDYLVLREVNVVERSAEDSASHQADPTSGHPLPPLILPASNSFDEYWSVSYEAYKHWLPFVLRMRDVRVPHPVSHEEEANDNALRAVGRKAQGNDITHRNVAHDPILAQIRSSFRRQMLQASVPLAFSTSASVLHLLPLLHQLYSTDWTLALSKHDGNAHPHDVLNADARKKGLHEEGSQHEDAAKELMGAAARHAIHHGEHADGSDPNPHDDAADTPLKSFEERHSCSAHFTSLADSLSCLWCVRASSRHWLRSVMSPEYIAAYTRKLFTLYSHALVSPPTAKDVAEATVPLIKLKTQSDVREFIKQLVFSTRNMDD